MSALSKAFVSALLLSLAACGHARSPAIARARSSIAGWPIDAVAYSWSGFTVAVEPAVATDPVRLGRILGAVDVTANDFSGFTSRSISATWIGVVSAHSFKSSDGYGYQGQWCIREGFADTILTIEGDRQELPVLFHELVHRVFSIFHLWPIDDPRWTAWNDETARVAAQLRAR